MLTFDTTGKGSIGILLVTALFFCTRRLLVAIIMVAVIYTHCDCMGRVCVKIAHNMW